jgi:NADPH-dependent curcumin reductase CurA
VNKIDPKLAAIESSLSWLGMPGMTAYIGLLDVGRPRPGDTVVVSAASGAVGQLVGQIAKLAGCRAIAVAGDDNKLKWCREIGFDAAINYKKSADLTAAMKEACPAGVDVFFDNTAGPIHDAVMKNLSIGARVIICGRVALAGQFGKPDIGERFMGQLIVTRASVHGFMVLTGGIAATKRCGDWPLGTTKASSGLKRTCSRASNGCPRHFYDCSAERISASRS